MGSEVPFPGHRKSGRGKKGANPSGHFTPFRRGAEADQNTPRSSIGWPALSPEEPAGPFILGYPTRRAVRPEPIGHSPPVGGLRTGYGMLRKAAAEVRVTGGAGNTPPKGVVRGRLYQTGVLPDLEGNLVNMKFDRLAQIYR